MSESTIAVVGLYYFFIATEGIMRRTEQFIAADDEAAMEDAHRKGTIIKCRIIRCMQSNCIFARIGLQNGDDQDHYCAGLAADDACWLGHTKGVLKCDTESTIKALRTRATRILEMQERARTTNGGVEVGVKIVRGGYRTLVLCLEARLGKYLPVTHAINAWLLQHTCALINVRWRGSDG